MRQPQAKHVALAGALLAGLSLAVCVFSIAVTFALPAAPAGPAEQWRAIGIDVALYTGFALHHSLFARTGLRARVARAVSPELERPAYVWIASLLLIGLCLCWQPVHGDAWAVRGTARVAIGGLQLLGLWIVLRASRALDLRDLVGLPSRQAASGINGSPLDTAGPYGVIRHPLYAGCLLLVLATPEMTMTRLVFAVLTAVYIVLAIPFEERTLSATSGAAYRDYSRSVRWRLVPGIYSLAVATATAVQTAAISRG